VQAGSGEERMVAQKIRFPAWRTAQVGEKFGINASAFKAAFSARRELFRQSRNSAGVGHRCGLRPAHKAESRLHGT
jgi:hypothetical protein